MNYEASPLAVTLFFAFVGLTLGLSFWLGRKAKSSAGYFAAHGEIPWFVNGVAFAGDYLSAASFLGICGMIAFYGYDGFLYSIGYLAGWIVALFVIAEPMKRLGKFTFADALDAKFAQRGENTRWIKIAAGLSTLAVSVFYLIPQMVGAGVLVTPLLGLPHWAGVTIVGITVILIVTMAGMVSTTWVQFLKGALLVVFSAILTWMILDRGFVVGTSSYDDESGVGTISRSGGDEFRVVGLSGETTVEEVLRDRFALTDYEVLVDSEVEGHYPEFVRGRTPESGRTITFWVENPASRVTAIWECQSQTVTKEGDKFIDGISDTERKLASVGEIIEIEGYGPIDEQQESGAHTFSPAKTGAVGPFEFFDVLGRSRVLAWRSRSFDEPDGSATTIYYPKPTDGSALLTPGQHPKFAGIRGETFIKKVDFLSLMLALFCGTASLPHILIRYYTVKDAAAARKSTIVGIATIGFFYVLTLYMGLGAMTSGALDPTNSNMSAPLLARSFSEWIFAAISAIAFTTVLGTVSGLILASAGAVAHDLARHGLGIEMNDNAQVRLAKIASIFVGVVAIILGIAFEGFNVSYLVGWAFSVAASANLPSLVMLLFWKKTTRQGVVASIIVGMVASLGWILTSADTVTKVFGLPESAAITPFTQPGLVTIPLSFIVLVMVSLVTQPTDRV